MLAIVALLSLDLANLMGFCVGSICLITVVQGQWAMASKIYPDLSLGLCLPALTEMQLPGSQLSISPLYCS